MKKRILTTLLASAMILSIAGCNNQPAETTTTTKAPEAPANNATDAPETDAPETDAPASDEIGRAHV